MKQYVISAILTLYVAMGCDSGKRDSGQPVTATIRVQSIVCGMCAQNVEKAITKLEGIEEVKVDVAAKTAAVTFVPALTNLEAIETTIVNAGYDANEKRRNQQAYEKLDACCKLDG